MEAICRLCDSNAIERIVQSPIVSINPQEKASALGQAMLDHITTYHAQFMSEIVLGYSRLFNGMLVMNQFELDEQGMKEDVEKMRDKLADKLMEFSPEDEEEDLDEEQQEQLVAILEESRRLLTEAVLVDKDNTKFTQECGEVMELIDGLLDEIDDDDEEDDDDDDNCDEDEEEEELEEEGKTIEMIPVKPSA